MASDNKESEKDERRSSSESMRLRHDPYAALRIPQYRFYIIGWTIVTLGTRIQSVAIAWEMYQRTGEPLALGLVGLAQALPTMALAIPAGYLADRYDRTVIVRWSLIAMTLTSVALAILSFTQGSTSLMYLFLFLDATAVILGRPARVSLMPQIVPPAVFPNAVTWNTSLSHMTAVVGPALGGLVVAVNVPLAYVIAAATSLIFVMFVGQLHLEQTRQKPRGVSWNELLAGVRFVKRENIILTMISLDMFAVLLGGATYLLPVYAEDILKVGAEGFGWLRAAPALGALTMAATLVFLPPMKRAGWMLLLNVAGFGVATIIFGISTSFWLSFAMLFLTGAFDNVSMVIRQTLQQLLTPDRMRGRVSAVSSVFVGASNELGGLESGLVAQWLGPVFAVVSGGIGTLIVVAVTAFASPQLRRMGYMHEVQPIGGDDEEAEAQPALATSTVEPGVAVASASPVVKQ